MITKTDLEIIAKQIEHLERIDNDYLENPKWKRLRDKQEKMFFEFANNQLNDLNARSYKSKKVLKTINDCENYIKRGEKNENIL